MAQDVKGPITQQELVPLTLWIEVLGKALVAKGVLSKEDLIAQLNDKLASGGSSLEREIERMTMQVDTW